MDCGFRAAARSKPTLKVNIVILPVCSSKVIWGQEKHEYALGPNRWEERPQKKTKNDGKWNSLETQTLADYA